MSSLPKLVDAEKLHIYFKQSMDQKTMEGKMLAITDGKNDGSRGASSYVMSPSDRKAVAETRSYAGKFENTIVEAQRSFGNSSWLIPSWLEIWWDAKGIFNSSNQKNVIEHMEKHRIFYEAVVTFSVMVEKGDKGSYKSLLNLHKDISEMEEEAKRDAKSKAICRMLKNFLNEKYKLDHNLKRVECVVLQQKIDDVEKTCERSREAVDNIGKDMKDLLKENRETKELLRKQTDLVEILQAENETCKSMVGSMEKKMEDLCLESDRRAEEANRKFEARIQKMAEQQQRELQKITKMLASMKGRFEPENNFP